MNNKDVSPLVTFLMGLFMIFSAVVYTLIIDECYDLSTAPIVIRLWLLIPAIALLLGGLTSMIWAAIVSGALTKFKEFSQLEEDWEQGHW